jgi:DNA polymerase elongation subunit (family B)
MAKRQSLTLQAFAWDCLDFKQEREDGRVIYSNCIFGFCHDPESNVVLLRIAKQPLVAYFRLPGEAGPYRLEWNQQRLDAVLGRFLDEATCLSSTGKTYGVPRPLEAKLVRKKPIYGYREDETFPCLEATFETSSNLRSFSDALTCEPLNVEGSLLLIKREEQNISPIRRFLTDVNLRYTQWFTVLGCDEPQNKTTEGPEYVCRACEIRPMSDEESRGFRVRPTILSFDIETYSSHENAMPHPQYIEDETTMISAVFRRDGDSADKLERTEFVNGDAYPIPGARVVRCASEKDTYAKFFNYIIRRDPTVITGYNYSYDFDYINKRLERIGMEWPYLGRLRYLERDQKRQFQVNEWQSRSGGKHSNRFMAMDGRVLLDMLLEVKNLFKLPSYRLEYVAQVKLGETKREVKHKESFRDRKRYLLAHNALFECVGQFGPKLCGIADAAYAEEVPKGIPDHMEKDDLLALAPRTEAAIAAAIRENGAIVDKEAAIAVALEYHRAKLLATKEAEYNLVDSVLVDRLFAKLITWLSSVQFAYIMGVSLNELQTKGQQIKCISQIYDEAHKDNFLITTREKTGLHYQGGLVQPPKIGIWHNALCFDFSGMYPSIMIAYNISTDTWVTAGHEVKDEDLSRFRFTAADFAQNDSDDENAGKSRAFREKEKQAKKARAPTKKQKEAAAAAAAAAGDKTALEVRFVKGSVRLGVIPRVAQRLVNWRNEIKKKMGAADKAAKAAAAAEAEAAARLAAAEKALRAIEERADRKADAAPAKREAKETRLADAGETPSAVERLRAQEALAAARAERIDRETEKEIYNQQQLAIKVVANSLYGSMGVKEGRLPFVEGAMCVTQKGREMIMAVRRYLEERYGATIIYGDTDSVMAVIPGIEGPAMARRGPALAEEMTRVLFGEYPSIKLEYEKGIPTMLIYTRKKYAATLDGHDVTANEILRRGTVIVRKGNCRWIQDFFGEMEFHALMGGQAVGALRIIFDQVRRLFDSEHPRHVRPNEDLVVILEYGGPYSSSYFLGTFADRLQARGKEIAAGDRLEYVVTVTEAEERGAKANLGEKMELIEDYSEALQIDAPMKLDYLYYLKNVAQRNIDQLFGIAYAADAAKLGAVEFKYGRRVRTAAQPITLIYEEILAMGHPSEREIVSRLGELEARLVSKLPPGGH